MYVQPKVMILGDMISLLGVSLATTFGYDT